MKCASCEAQIPASFGHAIGKNECPACGSALMDEESMAIVEELRGFILGTVKVREETANALALALVAAYSISSYEGTVPTIMSKRQQVKRPSKIAEVYDEEAGDGGIVKASDLFDPDNPIAPEERESILQERIETRLIANSMIPSKVATRLAGSASGKALSDRELAESPVLEAMRLERLQKQEQNMLNNPSGKCSPITRKE